MPFGLPSLPVLDISNNMIGFIAVFLIFGGGGMVRSVIASMNQTRIELAQLRAQQNGSQASSQEIAALRAEMAALREQMHDLRDTTTQYDLSFDTALHRMERRVEQMEQQQRLQH